MEVNTAKMRSAKTPLASASGKIDACKEKIAGIKIPSDFGGTNNLKGAITLLESAKKLVEAASGIADKKASEFDAMEKSNLALASELLTIRKKQIIKKLINFDGIDRSEGTTADGKPVRGESFLMTAENVWKYVFKSRDDFYYDDGHIKAIPFNLNFLLPGNNGGAYIRSRNIDCSSLICDILYEYGYNEFQGSQLDTRTLYNRAQTYANKYGWQCINNVAPSDLRTTVKDGDIVVYPGHTFMIKRVKKNKDGSVKDVVTYDAGDIGHFYSEKEIKEKGYRNINEIETNYYGGIVGTHSEIIENPNQPKFENVSPKIIRVEDLSYEEGKILQGVTGLQ